MSFIARIMVCSALFFGTVCFVEAQENTEVTKPLSFENADQMFCLHNKDFTIKYEIFPIHSRGKEKWYPVCELGVDPTGSHYGPHSIGWKIEGNYYGTIFWYQPTIKSQADYGGIYRILKTATPPVYNQWRKVEINRRGEVLSIFEDGELVLQSHIEGGIACNTAYPFRLGYVTMNAVEYRIDMESRNSRARLRNFYLQVDGVEVHIQKDMGRGLRKHY